MNHLNFTLFIFLASALAAMSNSASGQMMRQSQPPPQHVDMNARELLVSEDHWINAIVDRWTSPQRQSWQSLDRSFRGWVSHLVWVRKNLGKPTAIADLQGPLFQVPSTCPVAAFVAPLHSVVESMGYFREVLPDINWHAWNGIEPRFRELAEWEMSAEHERAQVSRALENWWKRNSDSIQSCLSTAEQSYTRTSSTTASPAATVPSPAPQPNLRNEQIDRRAKAEQWAVDHMIAPAPIKQEAREQISDAAAVDKYISAVDGRKL
jgi:hypothetical protein